MTVTVSFEWSDHSRGSIRIDDARIDRSREHIEEKYGVRVSDGKAARHVLESMFELFDGSQLTVMYDGSRYEHNYIAEEISRLECSECGNTVEDFDTLRHTCQDCRLSMEPVVDSE